MRKPRNSKPSSCRSEAAAWNCQNGEQPVRPQRQGRVPGGRAAADARGPGRAPGGGRGDHGPGGGRAAAFSVPWQAALLLGWSAAALVYVVWVLRSIAGQDTEATALVRSEEHTSELQSHSFISYAVF